MQLKYSHTVPADCAGSSLKMTCCNSKSLHDSLAQHHRSLWWRWRGVKGSRCNGMHACSPAWCSRLPMVLALTEWLMEGFTARWMCALVAVGSVVYSAEACLLMLHANETWIIGMSHDAKPTHQVSSQLADSSRCSYLCNYSFDNECIIKFLVSMNHYDFATQKCHHNMQYIFFSSPKIHS